MKHDPIITLSPFLFSFFSLLLLIVALLSTETGNPTCAIVHLSLFIGKVIWFGGGGVMCVCMSVCAHEMGDGRVRVSRL
jgi:cytosine/uracil/thiamine/allantoin permease